QLLESGANYYYFVRNDPVNLHDYLGLKIDCDFCSNFLKDALNDLRQERASDWLRAFGRGVIITAISGAIAVTGGAGLVIGVIVEGAGVVIDLAELGSDMADLQARLGSIFNLYNKCVEHATRIP